MKKVIEGVAEVFLTTETSMSVEEFMNKFHPENIIDQKLQLTLSDGSVHMIDIPYFMKLIWETVEDNKKAIETATR